MVPEEAPPLEINDRLELEVQTSEAHRVVFPVRVASIDSMHAPVRIGLQFLDLTAVQMRVVDRLIQKLGRAVIER